VDRSSHPDLTFVAFRAAEQPERLLGWYETQARGFHQGRTSETHRGQFGEHLAADDVLLRGVWEDAPALGTGALPVATYASYDKTINTGRGLQPVLMVSDVTVSPTHRRRGLLRALISEDLRDAAARGVPLAALTASEGSIYGRFGFGPAVFQHAVEVDTGPRFALRELDDDGSLLLLEPVVAWPAVEQVFATFHSRTRGSVERPRFYEDILTGTAEGDGGPDKMLRTAVHVDATGEPDGYAAYWPTARKDGGGPRSIKVADLVALTSPAHLRLWRFLADIDLSSSVEWSHAPVDDPLAWALVDPYTARTTGTSDSLWLRVLDVPAALEARPWGRDGTLVLEVDDPLGHAAGRFQVTTVDGDARVTRTEEAADVLLAADTLGSLYLGGVRVETLRAAGRLTGADDAVRTWAAMADTGPAPHCLTSF
jgi:predicted acetyltransferase